MLKESRWPVVIYNKRNSAAEAADIRSMWTCVYLSIVFHSVQCVSV